MRYFEKAVSQQEQLVSSISPANSQDLSASRVPWCMLMTVLRKQKLPASSYLDTN